MMTSPTSESTILPKAPPMMTPTARSITLPLTANSLNSDAKLTFRLLLAHRRVLVRPAPPRRRACRTVGGRRAAVKPRAPRGPAPWGPRLESAVDPDERPGAEDQGAKIED